MSLPKIDQKQHPRKLGEDRSVSRGFHFRRSQRKVSNPETSQIESSKIQVPQSLECFLMQPFSRLRTC